MNHTDIALQITLRAMEQGLIAVKPPNLCSGPDQWESANQFVVKQVNDFYQETLRRLNETAL